MKISRSAYYALISVNGKNILGVQTLSVPAGSSVTVKAACYIRSDVCLDSVFYASEYYANVYVNGKLVSSVPAAVGMTYAPYSFNVDSDVFISCSGNTWFPVDGDYSQRCYRDWVYITT